MFVGLKLAFIPICTRSISMYPWYIMTNTCRMDIPKIHSNTTLETYKKLVTWKKKLHVNCLLMSLLSMSKKLSKRKSLRLKTKRHQLKIASIVVWRHPLSNIIMNLTTTNLLNHLYTPLTLSLVIEANTMTAITTTTFSRMTCLCASSPILRHTITVQKRWLTRLSKLIKLWYLMSMMKNLRRR